MGGSRAALVWLGFGTDWVVRARVHTDGAAASWGPAVDLQLSTGASLPGAAPKVAMSPNDVAIVTWKQMGNSDEDAAFSFYLPTAAGNGWPSGPLVSTDLSFSAGGTADPVLAIGANDEGMWLFASTGYVRAVSFLGVGTSGQGGTVSQIGPSVRCPAVSVNASGHAMGAWIETPTGGPAGVTAWYSSDDQSSQTRTSTPLGTAAPSALGCPRVALDDLGRAIAVWSVTTTAGGSSIAYATYDPGSGWSVPASTVDTAGLAAYNPDVALSRAGEGFLFWEQATTTSASAPRDVRAVHLQLSRGLDAAGPQAIGATAPAANPRLVITGAGSALAVWAQGNRIWSSSFAAASGGWLSPAAPIDTVRSQYVSQNPDLATDGAGRAIAAWESTTGGIPDVVVARFE
jgi:hypothetical protein